MGFGVDLLARGVSQKVGSPLPHYLAACVISAPGCVLDRHHQSSLQDTHHTIALVIGAVQLTPHGQAIVRLNVTPASQEKDSHAGDSRCQSVTAVSCETLTPIAPSLDLERTTKHTKPRRGEAAEPRQASVLIIVALGWCRLYMSVPTTLRKGVDGIPYLVGQQTM